MIRRYAKRIGTVVYQRGQRGVSESRRVKNNTYLS